MYLVRVSIVEFIVENNVEYHYSTKYSTINPTIFNNGIKIKIRIGYVLKSADVGTLFSRRNSENSSHTHAYAHAHLRNPPSAHSHTHAHRT